MKVFYDAICGPMLCLVVEERDDTYVVLRFQSGEGFSGIDPPTQDFTANKKFCWKNCRRLTPWGNRHELSGRPKWRKS